MLGRFSASTGGHSGPSGSARAPAARLVASLFRQRILFGLRFSVQWIKTDNSGPCGLGGTGPPCDRDRDDVAGALRASCKLTLYVGTAVAGAPSLPGPRTARTVASQDEALKPNELLTA